MSRDTIFLAEVTKDLEKQYKEIKGYLEQRNIQVVSVNSDTENHTDWRQLIENSKLFVQLLSYSDPESVHGIITPQLQYQCAINVGLPILQWIEPNNDSPYKQQLHLAQWLLKCPSFKDSELMKTVNKYLPFADRITYSAKPQLLALNIAEHCINYNQLNELVEVVGIFDNGTIQFSAFKDTINLFISPYISITHLDDFKRNIIQEIDKIESEAEQDSPVYPLVFINIVPEDEDLAEEIGDFLQTNGIGSDRYAFELANGIKYFEDRLKQCDAVIMLYDNTILEWAIGQFTYYLQAQTRRREKLKIIAVCHKLPTEKSLLSIKLPNLQFFECASLKDHTCLPSFLRFLKQ